MDSPDEKLRDRALLANASSGVERDGRANPEKCIECVSAKSAVPTLPSAALESFADRVAFREFVIKEANDRGVDGRPGRSPEVIDDFANVPRSPISN